MKKLVMCITGWLLVHAALPSVALADATSGASLEGTSAQASAPGADQLEEVVVTAQRHEQNVDKVPISIDVLSAAAMRDMGVTDTTGLAGAVPSLNFTQTGPAGSPFLRGVGSQTSGANFEQSVATYIDGVYLPSGYANLFDFNGVARVEVLEGPQGTLFGRNATGGVISVVTKDPSDKPALDVSLGYANYNTTTGSLYGAGPVMPGLAADISAYFRDQVDGWGHDVTTNAQIFEPKDAGVRSKWIWDASESTKITSAIDYNYNSSTVGLNRIIYPGYTGLDGVTKAGRFFDSAGDDKDAGINRQGGIYVRIDHDFSVAQFDSISAYRRTNTYEALDNDMTPLPLSYLYAHPWQQSATEELQLLSPAASAIQWISGIFLFHDQTFFDPHSRGVIDYDLVDHFLDKSAAAYGQVTVPVLPDTNLTGGFRYTVDDHSANLNLNLGGVPVAADAARRSDHVPTWRLSLDHQIDNDVMIFTSYNRGFKSGQFNITDLSTIQPERLDAYEIGMKSALLDRRLHFNVSGFYYDFKNLQLNRVTEAGIVLVNAPRATIKGAEMNLIIDLVHNLKINLNAAYLHAVYENFPDAVYGSPNPAGGAILDTGDAAGNTMIQSPKLSYGITANYRMNTSLGDFTVTGGDSYKSKYYFTPDDRLGQAGFHLVNASLTWQPNDKPYYVRLWGNNLMDQFYKATADVGALGAFYSPAAPRTYGVTVGTTF